MDTSQLAEMIVALMSPYFVIAGEAIAKKTGEAAWGQVERIYEKVQNKFKKGGNEEAQEALQNLEKSPNSEVEQKAMEQVLDKALQTDPDFKNTLDELVKKLAKDEHKFVTNVSGKATVSGGIYNIDKVDILEINKS